MALRVFETEDAKYYLGLGNHIMSSIPIFEEVDFSKLDMFVFEDCASSDLLRGVATNVQYSDLVDRIEKDNPGLSMYGVDVSVGLLSIIAETIMPALGFRFACESVNKMLYQRKELSRRGFIKQGSIFLGGTFLVTNPFLSFTDYKSKECSSVAIETVNLKTSLLPTPLIGFRNAVAAKKISEYLVPKHKTGNKKVEVAMIYGAMHSGIETEILNSSISDITLDLYHNTMGYKEREEMNEIRELKGLSRIVYHDCELF